MRVCVAPIVGRRGKKRGREQRSEEEEVKE